MPLLMLLSVASSLTGLVGAAEALIIFTMIFLLFFFFLWLVFGEALGSLVGNRWKGSV